MVSLLRSLNKLVSESGSLYCYIPLCIGYHFQVIVFHARITVPVAKFIGDVQSVLAKTTYSWVFIFL